MHFSLSLRAEGEAILFSFKIRDCRVATLLAMTKCVTPVDMLANLISTYTSGLRLFLSRRVPTKVKVGIIIILVLYFLLPIDFLPDFLPLLGIFDELTLVFLIFHFLLKRYSTSPPVSTPEVIDAEIIE